MKKFVVFFKNTLLVITSICVPIIITDIYFRVAGIPLSESRILLLSGGNLSSGDDGIRKYSPNSQIRHSAVYGNSLEYSYLFNTDKNGFRITHNCELKDYKDFVAISGDSFSEGQGSKISWTYDMQENFWKKGIQSVNLSIAGYGVVDIEKSLKFAKKKLGATKAIVAIITEDIYRPSALIKANAECSMYLSKNFICGESSTWWHHPFNFDENDIIKFAKSKYNVGLVAVLKETLSPELKIKIQSIFNKKYDQKNDSSKLIQNSILSMRKISSLYDPENVLLIILPTKTDRNLNTSEQIKAKRSRDLLTFINGIDDKVPIKDLRQCPLNAKHFFKKDGHPNEMGQQLLGKCAIK